MQCGTDFTDNVRDFFAPDGDTNAHLPLFEVFSTAEAAVDRAIWMALTPQRHGRQLSERPSSLPDASFAASWTNKPPRLRHRPSMAEMPSTPRLIGSSPPESH
jgi:hypothetical protein